MQNQIVSNALQLHRAGRLGEAKSLYEQALALNPSNVDALHLLGLILLQSGEAEAAAVRLKRAVALSPKNAAFHSNLGAALTSCGKPREALNAFRQAGKLNPGEPQYQMAIGNSYALCGEHVEAERWLRKLTAKFPGYALGWFNLGNALRDQQRGEEAINCYQRVITLDPGLANAHNNLGSVLHSLGRLEAAETAYRRSIAIESGNAMVYCNLASVLIDRGLFTQAEAACHRAIGLQADLATAHSFLGATYSHLGRLDESLVCFRRAADLDRDNVLTIAAVGDVLHELGRHEDATRYLHEAEARVSAADTKSLQQLIYPILLKQGQWKEGWERFAHRESRHSLTEKYRILNLSTTLAGPVNAQTILVLHEQGLGDEIFFLRYAPALSRLGARIIYQSGAKIAGILARVPSIAAVITDGEAMPQANQTLLLGDLPNALGTLGSAEIAAHTGSDVHTRLKFSTETTLITHDAYSPPPPLPLTARLDCLQRMKQRLNAVGLPPYIGITWRAGTPPALQRGTTWSLSKEADIDQLGQALSSVQGSLIALQRNPAPGELKQFAAAANKPLHDFCALNEDLEEMLALLALLDEYIGVSNTNMHLRAGTGKSARVLVPRPAEWRWLSSGDRSPWFPNFPIYRQSTNGDWQPALQQLASDLRA